MSQFNTAATIIGDVAVELGLVAYANKPADPFGSSDSNIGQLCQLLKPAGRRLLLDYNWSQFQTEYTFTTTAGVATYSLPADFLSMINQTWWNRTNRLPVGGPLSPQEWQYMKARLVGVVFNVLFRPYAGNLQLKLYPDTSTPGNYTIAFEYKSRWWVMPSGQAAPTTDTPSAKDDTIYFDPHLITRALKAEWALAKGMDATAILADLSDAVAMLKSADSPQPILDIGRRSMSEPLIGSQNIPITGFGS